MGLGIMKAVIFSNIFFVTVILLFSSCQTFKLSSHKNHAKKATADSRAKFVKIKKVAHKRNAEKTIEQLDVFISNNKHNELIMAAYLLKARLLNKQRKHKQACQVYYKASQLPYFYKDEHKAHFAAANCYLKNNKIENALLILENTIHSPQESVNIKKRSIQKQWNLIKNKKSFIVWKIKSLSHLVEFYPKHRNKKTWESRAKNIIASLNKKQLIKLHARVKGHKAFEGLIFYNLGLHYWKSNNAKKSRHYFIQALSSSLNPEIKSKAKDYLSIVESNLQVRPQFIGVVLPLSGSKKTLGQKILRGLNIGFDLEHGSPWQIIVMDSKGQADVAKSVTEQLLKKHHVITIIGGVTYGTAQAISEVASSFGVPAVLFSPQSGLTANKEFVFQNALTGKNLMDHLSMSIRTRKIDIKKVAILAPNDSYGREYSKIFKKSFQEQGGAVTNIQTYKTGEINFKTQIKKLVGLYNLDERKQEYEQLKKEYLKKHPNVSKRSKKLEPYKLLKPIVEFDALFIPDSFSTLTKIEAYLKYYGIRDIYLLGTNLWSPTKIKKWSKYRPLVFVNTPTITNDIIRSSNFYDKYRAIFSRSPGLIERQSFNTARAVKTALEKNIRNSLELRTELRNLKKIKGAYFEFDISEDQRFLYPLETFMTHKNSVISVK